MEGRLATHKTRIATLIRDKRKSLGMTQRELGDMIFVSNSQVSRYENGIDLPSPEIASSIARILDIDLSGALAEVARTKEINRRKAIRIEIVIGEDLIGTPAVGEILQVLRKYG